MWIAERAVPHLVADTILVFAATVAVSLRMYVRRCILKNVKLDDWLMLGALVVFISVFIEVWIGVHYGIGQHREDIPVDYADRAYLVWWMCQIGYGVSTALARASIMFFLLRLTVIQWHQWLIYLGLAGNLVSGLSIVLVTFFRCWPISYSWTTAYPDAKGKCLSDNVYVNLGYLYGASAVAMDLGCIIFPSLLVYSLKLNLSTRIGLAVLLGCCGAGICAPLVRTLHLQALVDPDYLYASVPNATWSIVENGLAIIASSLASSRPLFVKRSCFSRHRHRHQSERIMTPTVDQEDQADRTIRSPELMKCVDEVRSSPPTLLRGFMFKSSASTLDKIISLLPESSARSSRINISTPSTPQTNDIDLASRPELIRCEKAFEMEKLDKSAAQSAREITNTWRADLELGQQLSLSSVVGVGKNMEGHAESEPRQLKVPTPILEDEEGGDEGCKEAKRPRSPYPFHQILSEGLLRKK